MQLQAVIKVCLTSNSLSEAGRILFANSRKRKKSAKKICGTRVKGMEVGSRTLHFQPGKVEAGDYCFEVGTAGSAILIGQTLLPAFHKMEKDCNVTISGGTHNFHAPPFEFFRLTFLPHLHSMGMKADSQLHNYGFYPAGGGKVSFSYSPLNSGWRRPIGITNEVTFHKVEAVIWSP